MNNKFVIQTPGHSYLLDIFEKDNTVGQELNFIHKEPDMTGLEPNEVTMGLKVPPYKTVKNGTTNEAVIEVLIDRLNYLQNTHQGGKFKCKENACAITHLEEAIHWLESRTNKRVARGVEGKPIV